MNDMTMLKVLEPIANEWSFPVDTYDLWATPNVQEMPQIEVPQNMGRALVRTDTHQVLGVHGSKYKAILHDDVVNSVMDAVQSSGVSKDYEFKVELFDNGAKLRGTIDFNDLVIEPQVGDTIRFQVLFYNSYDGSWAFQQQARGLRLWCLNGCTHADTIANTWAKHTTNVSVEGSAAKIQAGLTSFFETRDQYKEWMNTKVSDIMAEQFFKHAICRLPNNTSRIKYNETQLDKLMNCWFSDSKTLGMNKWALYNACTYWATHTEQSRSPANTRRLRENQLSKVFKKTNWEIA